MAVLHVDWLETTSIHGAEHGATISLILDRSEPGQGPRLHRHPYDETWVVEEGNIAFVYFQAAHDRPPARLEFPRWIVDAGLLDDVMTVVRAETIAATGYPYAIEAADAVAVISAHDRAQFYAAFQQFADRENLAFSFSRKSLSKNRRRV